MRCCGCVEGVCERRNREDRRTEHRQRRDHSRARRIEVLCAVADPAYEERDPEHEYAVRDHRADERRLHDADQTSVQREQRDEEFGEVSECRLHDTSRRRAHAPAELLGGATDETCKQRNRRGRGGKRKHGRHVQEMRSRGRSDEECRQACLPHVGSVHRPMINGRRLQRQPPIRMCGDTSRSKASPRA